MTYSFDVKLVSFAACLVYRQLVDTKSWLDHVCQPQNIEIGE